MKILALDTTSKYLSLAIAEGDKIIASFRREMDQRQCEQLLPQIDKLLKKAKLEIAVNDSFVQPTLDAILGAAKTGQIGDGKIFVLDLDRCTRIRTGEEGGEAIG